jgi:hypothetical protein
VSVTDLRRQAADLAGGTSRRERNQLYVYVLRAITATADPGRIEADLVQAVLGASTHDPRGAELARAAVHVVVADGTYHPTQPLES